MKWFYFFILYSIFFHSLTAFVFHLQRGFISFPTILRFFVYVFCKKILIAFTSLFRSLFVILVIFSWWIFRYFYISEKSLIKELIIIKMIWFIRRSKNAARVSYDFIMIYIIHKISVLLNSLELPWKKYLYALFQRIIIDFNLKKKNR